MPWRQWPKYVVCLSIHLQSSICLSVCPWIFFLLKMCQNVLKCVKMSQHFPHLPKSCLIILYVCLSICPSVCLSVCMSIPGFFYVSKCVNIGTPNPSFSSSFFSSSVMFLHILNHQFNSIIFNAIF